MENGMCYSVLFQEFFIFKIKMRKKQYIHHKCDANHLLLEKMNVYHIFNKKQLSSSENSKEKQLKLELRYNIQNKIKGLMSHFAENEGPSQWTTFFIENSDNEMQQQESLPAQNEKPQNSTLPIMKTNKTKKKYHWNDTQQKRYLWFLENHRSLFDQSLREKKKIRIHHEMAKCIKSRNNIQCRSHHQKMIQKYQTIDRIIFCLKNPTLPMKPIEKDEQHSECLNEVISSFLNLDLVTKKEASTPSVVSSDQQAKDEHEETFTVKMQSNIDDHFELYKR